MAPRCGKAVILQDRRNSYHLSWPSSWWKHLKDRSLGTLGRKNTQKIGRMKREITLSGRQTHTNKSFTLKLANLLHVLIPHATRNWKINQNQEFLFGAEEWIKLKGH